MRLKTRRLLFSLVGVFKVVFSVISSLSLALLGPHADAATPPTRDRASPLLSQSPSNQASIARMVDAIKTAAHGKPNADNISAALQHTASSEVNADMLVAALNHIKLNDAGLARAIDTIGDIFGIRPDQVVTKMVTDTYISQGKGPASRQTDILRKILGNKIVDQAFLNVPKALTDDVRNFALIEPAAGVYEN